MKYIGVEDLGVDGGITAKKRGEKVRNLFERF
jgi:hypothetical protein